MALIALLLLPATALASFTEQVLLPVTDGVLGAAAGDIDGNMAIDVVVADGALHAFVQTPVGWGHRPIPSGHAPFRVHMQDIDGDGDQDLITADAGGRVFKLTNDGSGQFSPEQLYNGCTFLYDVLLFDQDGDGHDDIAVACSGSSALLRADGVGGYQEATGVLQGDVGKRLSAGDLDEDGDQDLVSVDGAADRVTWYRNDGTAFTAFPISTAVLGARDVRVAHVNSDNRPDVVFIARDTVGWFVNQANGTFLEQNLSTTIDATSLWVADLDGNTTQDVVVSATGGGTRWANDGFGGFTPQSAPDVTDEILTATDHGRDGDIDLITAVNEVSLHINEAGALSRRQLAPWMTDASLVRFADVDQDGTEDVVIADAGEDAVYWWRRDPDLPEWITIAADVPDPRWVHAVDLDDDMDLDIAVASAGDDTVAWYRNDGTTFVAQVLTTVLDAEWVGSMDMDGDQDPDLVYGLETWARNDGTGVFDLVAFAQPAGDGPLRIADVDGDTDLDLFAPSLYWYRNDGSGVFSQQSHTGGPGGEMADFQVGDLDQDGDADVVYLGFNNVGVSWSVRWYQNNGATWLADTTGILLDAGTALQLADVDGLSGQDVVYSDASPAYGLVEWAANDGAGDFNSADTRLVTFALSPDALHAADIDQDGDQDILAAGRRKSPSEAHHTLAVYVNELVPDGDGDGFAGNQVAGPDCNDTREDVYPGAPELCDGVDNDCNGLDDAGAPGMDGQESDSDADGFFLCEGDCDDDDFRTYPAATEQCDGLDNDCDGTVPANESDGDGDGWRSCQDCDDTDVTFHPAAGEICDLLDNNCDGLLPPEELDGDGDGYTPCQGDCDDTDGARLPGATEVCNGLDDNCDGELAVVDDIGLFGGGLTSTDAVRTNIVVVSRDVDLQSVSMFLNTGVGQVLTWVVYQKQSASNVYDLVASTTTVATDAGARWHGSGPLPYALQRGDTYLIGVHFEGTVTYGGSVTAPETVSFGNVTGLAHFASVATPPTSGTPQVNGASVHRMDLRTEDEADADNDGAPACADCDEGDATVWEGAPELCDGVDNDCNGLADADSAGEVNGDADASLSCDDCDDADPTRFVGATEVCNGLDDDCDGTLPLDEQDGDADGESICEGDCDDADDARLSGTTEVCDGVDNDCDEVLPTDEQDGDGDGSSPCAGDCDDADPIRGATLTEVCDRIDNDCDQQLPANETDDIDQDGFVACEDCDDASAATYPGAEELCDGGDNDCDGITDETRKRHSSPIRPISGVFTGNQLVYLYTYLGYPQLDIDVQVDLTGLGSMKDITLWLCSPHSCWSLSDGHGGLATPETIVFDNDAPNGVDDPWVGPVVHVRPMVPIPSSFGSGQTINFSLIVKNDTGFAGTAGWHLLPEIDGSPDDDADGARLCEDCDDNNPNRYDGLAETCDGVDNDCDLVVPDDELDQDGDDQKPCEGDCDDNDAARFASNPEVCDGLDNDCDGNTDATELDGDGDGRVGCDGDCDDGDATRYGASVSFPPAGAAAVEVCDRVDNDCDQTVPADEIDGDGDDVTVCEGDCFDGAASIAPGQVDIGCDGIDQDCDGADAGNVDVDGDGVGTCEGDCDDSDANIGPGETDTPCDGVDQDCTGVDAGAEDADVDGVTTCGGDCDDRDATVSPSRAEQPCNGVDDDCNISTADLVDPDGDGVCAIQDVCWGLDSAGDTDGDGVCDDLDPCPMDAANDSDGDGSCDAVDLCLGDDTTGDADGDEICDDGDVCFGQDSSGDADGDGWCLLDVDGVSTVDCDDDRDDVYPGAAEQCDGRDNACAGQAPAEDIDGDGDGVSICGGDCDDQDPDRSPDATEICDGHDNDCDGQPGADEVDADDDHLMPCDGDCDDDDATAGSHLPEVCGDGRDNDCNGVVDDDDCLGAEPGKVAPADEGCGCDSGALTLSWWPALFARR